ncbi:MAG TPA: hypothetical protein VGI40_07645 [Pirellulaceae bacterium]|jgi:hypothetical protein
MLFRLFAVSILVAATFSGCSSGKATAEPPAKASAGIDALKQQVAELSKALAAAKQSTVDSDKRMAAIELELRTLKASGNDRSKSDQLIVKELVARSILLVGGPDDKMIGKWGVIDGTTGFLMKEPSGASSITMTCNQHETGVSIVYGRDKAEIAVQSAKANFITSRDKKPRFMAGTMPRDATGIYYSDSSGEITGHLP